MTRDVRDTSTSGVALSNGPTLDLLLRIDLCFPLITPTQTMPLLQPKMTHRAGNAEQNYRRAPRLDLLPTTDNSVPSLRIKVFDVPV